MANKEVIIRVDGNSNIGLGHIYRGIALAEMLKDEFDVKFITKHSSNISPISDAGFKLNFIPGEIELQEEPAYFNEILSKGDIVVLDGYDFKEEYQQKIKDNNYKLVYIDDLAQGVQKADLVINHSPGAKESDYKKEKYSKLKFGLDYTFLRPSFLKRIKKKEIINKLESVFVCFGGADSNNYSLKVTKYLLEIKSIKKINIVLGSAYSDKRIYNLPKKNINIYQNLSEEKLKNLMLKCDFAIVPSSTILIELLALKIPIISGYFIENQKTFYDYLKSNRIISGIDSFDNINKNILVNTIKNLNTNNVLANNLIDGNQKKRFINLFKNL